MFIEYLDKYLKFKIQFALNSFVLIYKKTNNILITIFFVSSVIKK